MSGPLFALTWYGTLLPCLEKDEDRQARQALARVNQAGQHIQWYPKGSTSPPTSPQQAASAAVNSVVGFFRRSLSNNGSSDDDDNNENGDEGDRVPAKLMVRDNPDTGVPEIFVDPIENNTMKKKKKRKKTKKGGAAGSDDGSPTSAAQQQSVGYKLNIALHRVGTVDLNPETGVLRIMAKPPSDPELSVKTLVTLELLTKDNDAAVAVPADDRDAFVHHLLVLLEWERQRRIANHIEDSLTDEEEGSGNFLTQRAKKAAHFAKRELEMQQTKRQRESRKTKLIQDSGGLKYTALAMMQRQENAA